MGAREKTRANVKTQSILPAVDTKEYKPRTDSRSVSGRGANDTYTLVVEGQCPTEYRCKYDPHGKEPNIDSAVDSLNDSFEEGNNNGITTKKIGESKAQYSRRVGSKNPPRTVGRPQTNNSKKPRRQVGMRVPTKATQKLVPKSKPVTVTGKNHPYKKSKGKKVDPDRRRPIVKKPTPKQVASGSDAPTRRTLRPKTKLDTAPKSFQDLMKEIAKRQPKRPPRPPKNEAGLPPKRPIAIRPGLPDPKGNPITLRPPIKPPTNNVENF